MSQIRGFHSPRYRYIVSLYLSYIFTFGDMQKDLKRVEYVLWHPPGEVSAEITAECGQLGLGPRVHQISWPNLEVAHL
eukprot:4466403-Pyramimonas_sp.AAC.1